MPETNLRVTGGAVRFGATYGGNRVFSGSRASGAALGGSRLLGASAGLGSGLGVRSSLGLGGGLGFGGGAGAGALALGGGAGLGLGALSKMASFRAGVAPLRARLGGRVFKIGGYGYNPSFLSSTTTIDAGVSPLPALDPSLPSVDAVQLTRMKEKDELQALNNKFASFIDKVGCSAAFLDLRCEALQVIACYLELNRCNSMYTYYATL